MPRTAMTIHLWKSNGLRLSPRGIRGKFGTRSPILPAEIEELKLGIEYLAALPESGTIFGALSCGSRMNSSCVGQNGPTKCRCSPLS